MSSAPIVFDGVWKKFRRGEHHDSLRDLIPAAARMLLRRRPPADLEQDEFWVMRDVSFEVRPGEALGIIGQNGAGKSTALKLLTRILKPTRGQARVRGRVGALIEVAAGFHPDLTGRENVFLQGAIMGMRRDDITRRFDEIVAFSSLEEFIDTPVKRYSSGMNARLGFAIAAHLDPEVLLIDEVLAVGDFTFQQKCYERLREFRRNGTTIAFVSHNMQAIASLCDRGVFLRRGQEPFCGPIDEVISHYVAATPSTSDARVRILDATLGDARTGSTAVQPGTSMRLALRLVSQVPLPRCGLALKVTRADGAVIFHGSSNVGGDVELDVQAGAEFACGVTFRANILRGTYIVSAQLVDSARLWSLIEVTGVGTFSITETTRISGYAELEPAYEMTAEPPSPLPAMALKA